VELLVVFLQRQKLLSMFLPRQFFFSLCCVFLFVEFNSSFTSQQTLWTHIGFFLCMIFKNSSCIITWLIIGHLFWKG